MSKILAGIAALTVGRKIPTPIYVDVLITIPGSVLGGIISNGIINGQIALNRLLSPDIACINAYRSVINLVKGDIKVTNYDTYLAIFNNFYKSLKSIVM